MKTKTNTILFRFIFFLPLYIYLSLATYAEEITFSAKKMSGNTGSKNDTISLLGKAHIETESISISADSITLQDTNYRYIIAEGTVICNDKQTGMDFTCQKILYDRNNKTVILQNEVHLTDQTNNVYAEAQRIDYNQNTQTAILQIAVTLKQKDNTCSSAYAIYYKQTQLLELDGNPTIIQGNDTFNAQQIRLNMDTQEITLIGNVNGTVTTETKQSQSETSKTPDHTAITDGETYNEH
ncbi:MAG: organic solvent tolerance protein OstA [Treponema sp.]|nr:organic solvent tolerance protein OstA [Treponema sp.]